jgi:hypothetical protein
MMQKLLILTSSGLMALGGVAFAQSQPNAIQGTPSSIFPHATSSEVLIVNGVPCRTALIQGSNIRVPVACTGPVGSGVGIGDPLATGSVRPTTTVRASPAAAPVSGTPGSVFPHATSGEVMIINGVPCRTALIQGSNIRVPVACTR